MFNVGMGQLIVILLIAFLVVGPKDLPKVARALGRAVNYAKNLWVDIVKSIDLDEEIEEAKNIKHKLKETAQTATPSQLIRPITQELEGVSRELKSLEKHIK